jgi:multiple sugar transport system ATP-binding protein
VAGFFGSPAMNFFPGETQTDGDQMRFTCSAFVLALGDLPMQHARHRNVVLGVRPHDLVIVDKKGADVTAHVDIIEPRGNELVVHLVLASGNRQHELTIVMPPEAEIRANDQIGLRFQRERLHFFDPDSGARLN